MKRFTIIYISILLLLPFSSQSQQIKIACIGNSITYGSGMENPATMSYPAQLQHWLGKDYQVRNFGVSGTTMLKKGDHPFWNREEFSASLDFNPDIVLIKLGTNDSKPQNWEYASEFTQDYLEMIKSYQSLASRPRILLMLPVPVFTVEKWGITDSIVKDQIIPKIQKIASETGCELIDLYTPLLDYPNYFPDQVHPDPLGASVMVEVIYRKLFHKTKEDGGGYFNPCTHPVPSFEYRSGAGWGEDKDWFSQHNDINKIGESRDVDLVFLGNSITQSWGGEGRNVWSPVNELWDSLYQGLNAANFGISGDRTQQVLWRIDNGNFDKIKPKLVVLTMGVNNFSSNSAAEIAAGIQAIIKKINKKSPASNILLLGPLPAGGNNEDPLRVTYNNVHKLISPLGKIKNVDYKNIGDAFILDNGKLDYSLMREDNVHLAPKGYNMWAECIQPEIDRFFKGN